MRVRSSGGAFRHTAKRTYHAVAVSFDGQLPLNVLVAAPISVLRVPGNVLRGFRKEIDCEFRGQTANALTVLSLQRSVIE
jgi:hypothetical protein